LLLAATCALAACSSSGGSASKAPVDLGEAVTNKGTATASGSSIQIEADDFFFSPTFIKAKPGTQLTIDIKNAGTALHTFTSSQLGVDQQISPGQTATVKITVPATGFAEFHCNFHSSTGMRGAIIAAA
jgi:plastocyanin